MPLPQYFDRRVGEGVLVTWQCLRCAGLYLFSTPGQSAFVRWGRKNRQKAPKTDASIGRPCMQTPLCWLRLGEPHVLALFAPAPGSRLAFSGVQSVSYRGWCRAPSYLPGCGAASAFPGPRQRPDTPKISPANVASRSLASSTALLAGCPSPTQRSAIHIIVRALLHHQNQPDFLSSFVPLGFSSSCLFFNSSIEQTSSTNNTAYLSPVCRHTIPGFASSRLALPPAPA